MLFLEWREGVVDEGTGVSCIDLFFSGYTFFWGEGILFSDSGLDV